MPAGEISAVQRHLDARLKAVQDVPLHSVKRSLRECVAVEETSIIREENDAWCKLKCPRTQGFGDAELTLE